MGTGTELSPLQPNLTLFCIRSLDVARTIHAEEFVLLRLLQFLTDFLVIPQCRVQVLPVSESGNHWICYKIHENRKEHESV